jgi:hypothetical protein
MKKLVDVPMGNLQDVIDWHNETAARCDQSAERHREKYKGYPKGGAAVVNAHLRRGVFHRKAAEHVARAVLSELHVQAALL